MKGNKSEFTHESVDDCTIIYNKFHQPIARVDSDGVLHDENLTFIDRHKLMKYLSSNNIEYYFNNDL